MRLNYLVAAFATLLAVALPAQAAVDARAETVTIRLVSLTTQVTVQKDVDPKNVASPGDVLAQKSQLRNAVRQFGKPNGALVGHDSGTITVVSLTVVAHKGTAVLPGGTIRFGGRVPVPGVGAVLTVPVTGGTGKFAGARGRVEIRTLRANRASNIYRLTLP
jgi:Dirigent-like protein